MLGVIEVGRRARGSRARLRGASVLGWVALLAGLLVVVAPQQPAAAFPAGLLAGTAPGETWVVCQGYNNSSITHSGTLRYSLDLTAALNGVGPTGCTPATANATNNKPVTAPANGVVTWNNGNGICINLDGGDSFKMYHVTGPAPGARVSAGQVIGNVYSAGLGANGGYAHLHIAAYAGSGCSSASGVPFAGGARLSCGAPDMTSSGAFNQWSGTQLTSSCGGTGGGGGGTDKDQDGLGDGADLCTTQPGPVAFRGCDPQEVEPRSGAADFNGDGRSDYCRRVGGSNGVDSRVACTVSIGAGFGATYSSPVIDWGYELGRAWADFDGDGRSDYCRVVGDNNGVGSRVACTVSTGTGFGVTYMSPVIDWGQDTGRAWVDVNDDGRSDYCRRVGGSNGVDSRVACTVSIGAGFGATYSSPVIDWGYELGRAWADFDGDGRSDYCRVVGDNNGVGSRVACTVSTGTGFAATSLSPVLDWGYGTGRAWADANGDGRADYCRRVGNSGVDARVFCTVSTGAGFGATLTSPVLDWGYELGRAWADFNGDGRSDYCRVVGDDNGVASRVACTVSSGTGFGATYISPVIDWGYDNGRGWVDSNGDGRADYCRVVGGPNGVASRVFCTVSTGAGFGATATSPVIDWGYDLGRAWTGSARRPGKPAIASASSGNRTVTLTWSAPRNSGRPPITGFTATASPGGATCSAASTRCTIGALANGVSYTFTVRATNAAGLGPASASSRAVVPSTVAGKVRLLNVRYPKAKRARITWKAPTNNGGATLTGYQFRWRPARAASWSAWVETGMTRAKTLTGLKRGRLYSVQVRALNVRGAGPVLSLSIRNRR